MISIFCPQTYRSFPCSDKCWSPLITHAHGRRRRKWKDMINLCRSMSCIFYQLSSTPQLDMSIIQSRNNRTTIWKYSQGVDVPFAILAGNFADMSPTCRPTRQMSSYLGRQAKCHDTEHHCRRNKCRHVVVIRYHY